jgi:CheY-like chemotaxis protein
VTVLVQVDADAPAPRFLVAEERVFQRRLVTETLRTIGRVHVQYANDCADCLAHLGNDVPDALLIDWDFDGGNGLSLVKRIRDGEAGDAARKLAIILIAARRRLGDVERARNAGVDEFVITPFSIATVQRRVKSVQKKRAFIESTSYTGPDRRRRNDPNYEGARRRMFDSDDREADAPDVQIRKGLARMYVERITSLLKALKPGDQAAQKDLALTCGQLSALAGDMKDTLLMSATSSMFNYIKGVGAEAVPDQDVVQAHLMAILQLAELPNHQIDIRRTVTQQLSVMVTKKLRQAGQAA